MKVVTLRSELTNHFLWSIEVKNKRGPELTRVRIESVEDINNALEFIKVNAVRLIARHKYKGPVW